MTASFGRIGAALLAACLPLAVVADGPVVSEDRFLTIEGIVTAFVAGGALGHPTLVVDDFELGEVEVRLAPMWFLTGVDFSVQLGDLVSVEAFACDYCTADFSAVVVENLTSGVTSTLRDDNGRPLWTRHSAPELPGANGNGPGASGIEPISATGTVVSLVIGPGVGQPLLTILVDGEPLEIVVTPYRAWASSGFRPVPGQVLDVTYMEIRRGNEPVLLGISVHDPVSNMTLYLRDPETGWPGAPYRLRHGPADPMNEGEIQYHFRRSYRND